MTTGESTTGEDGTLVIKGFAGSYEIEIINPANSASVTAQVQITEQESASEIIEAP